MKNFTCVPRLIIIAVLAVSGFIVTSPVKAQLSSYYNFSESAGTIANLTGGTVLASGGGVSSATDDAVFSDVAIGFNFRFNGATYTTLGVSTNGFIFFGTAPAGTLYNPVSSSGSYSGAIAAFSGNISGLGSGSEIRVETSGTAPSRAFTIVWKDFTGNGTNNLMNLSVVLHECSGQIDILVSAESGAWTTSLNGEVGLRGSSNADYLNRSVDCSASSWGSSAPGSSASSTCSIGTCFPGTQKLTYTVANYTSPIISYCSDIAPNHCNSVAQVIQGQVTGGVAPYSINWTWSGPRPVDTVGSKSDVPATFKTTGVQFLDGGMSTYGLTLTDGQGCVATCGSSISIVFCSAQSVKIDSIGSDSTLCICGDLDLKISTTGVFNHNNDFVAWLSDANGNFTNQVKIGLVFSDKSKDVIHATIPCNTPVGSGYRIRVDADSPPTPGAVDGIPLPSMMQGDAAVTITTSNTSICTGSTVTFYAWPVNGGSKPKYQWRVNGTKVNNAKSSYFSSNTIHDGDKISCLMTSSKACIAGSPDSSNVITMIVNPGTPPQKPVVTLLPPDSLFVSNVCGLCRIDWFKAGDNKVVSSATKIKAHVMGDYYARITDTSNFCSNTSNTVSVISAGIAEAVKDLGIELFPNPSKGNLTVNTRETVNEITVNNLLGQVVSRLAVTNRNDRSIAITLPNESGLYFIHVKGENTEFVGKVIKE